MHLIQTLLGTVVAAPSRPGRAAALEYSILAGMLLVAAAIGAHAMLGKLDQALALLAF